MNSTSPSQMKQNRRCHRRRVHFDTDEMGEVKAEGVAAPHRLLHSDLERCWWQRYELSELRSSAQEVVEAIEDGGDFIWVNGGRKPYCKSIDKAFRSCVSKKELSSSTRRDLEFWVSVGHSRRGLERHIVTSFGEERQRRRADIVDGVLFVQYRCWEEGLNEEQTPKLLRAASERISLGSARFSAAMGAADAVAARTEEDGKQMRELYEKAKEPRKMNNAVSIPCTSLRSPYYQRRILNSAA